MKGQLEDRFVERFGERLSKRLGERVWGRKPNMLQECFNVLQLPSPGQGLV